MALQPTIQLACAIPEGPGASPVPSGPGYGRWVDPRSIWGVLARTLGSRTLALAEGAKSLQNRAVAGCAADGDILIYPLLYLRWRLLWSSLWKRACS
jgi:hypothetical protein